MLVSYNQVDRTIESLSYSVKWCLFHLIFCKTNILWIENTKDVLENAEEGWTNLSKEEESTECNVHRYCRKETQWPLFSSLNLKYTISMGSKKSVGSFMRRVSGSQPKGAGFGIRWHFELEPYRVTAKKQVVDSVVSVLICTPAAYDQHGLRDSMSYCCGSINELSYTDSS